VTMIVEEAFRILWVIFRDSAVLFMIFVIIYLLLRLLESISKVRP